MNTKLMGSLIRQRIAISLVWLKISIHMQCFGSGFVFYGSGSWNFSQSGSGSRQKKLIFAKAIKIFWEKFLFSTQKVGILFLFSANQVNRYFNKQRTFIWYLSFLKISDNYEKFVEKVHFYCSISLPGTGSGFRIRIQPGNMNPDPPGSGSETLITCVTYLSIRSDNYFQN